MIKPNNNFFTETVTNNLDLVVQSFYTLIIAIVAFVVVFEIYFKFSLIRNILGVIFSLCRKFFGLLGMAKVTAIRVNENKGALSGNGEDKGKSVKSISADDYSSNSGSYSGSGDNRVQGTGTMKSVKFSSPNEPKKHKINDSDQENDSRVYFSHFNDFNQQKTSN
jgi:hypothetical protein